VPINQELQDQKEHDGEKDDEAANSASISSVQARHPIIVRQPRLVVNN
jgi:hypothetical protein